jgi:flagellar basal body-associated protein FliL
MANGKRFKVKKKFLIILSIVVVVTTAVLGGYEAVSLADSQSKGSSTQGVDL